MSDNPSTPFFASVSATSNVAAASTAGRSAGDSSSLPARGNGGVPRMIPGASGIQLGAAPQEQVTAPQPMRSLSLITGGVVRSTVIDGQQTTEHGESISRSSSGSGPASTSAIGTIRSELGVPHAGADVKLSDLITISGMTTTVAAARAAGYINRDGSGNWYEVGAASKAGPQQGTQPQERGEQPKEQPAEAVTIPRLDDASESILTEYTAKAGNFALTAGLESVLETGTIDDGLAASVGSRLGHEPGVVKEHVAQVQAAFTKQAEDHVGGKVLDWARASRLDSLKAAAREQVTSGTLNGYADLSHAYMMALPDADPNVILSSPDAEARGVRRERNGSITLEIPKVGRVEWRAAIKAGFIGPRFPGKGVSRRQ